MPRKLIAMDASNGNPKRRELAILINEFAAVRLWLDRNGNSARLLVEDLESGDEGLPGSTRAVQLHGGDPGGSRGLAEVGNYRVERRPRT